MASVPSEPCFSHSPPVQHPVAMPLHKTASTPLYLALAEQLAGMIRNGTFPPGARLPSIRQTSTQHQVSVPTVVQAYTVLEDWRLIEARSKSGFYVRAQPAAPPPSPASRRLPQPKSLAKFPPLMALVNDVVNPDFVRLGGGHPSPELLPAAKLARLMAAVARRQPAAVIQADPAPGCAKLRLELSRRALDWGCYLPPDEFLITNGASEALYLALSVVTQPGDAVLIEAPTHYGVLNLMSRLKLRAIALPAENLEPAHLNRIFTREKIAAAVVAPNFSNPRGVLMPHAIREALISLATEYHIPLIEDDVFGDLPHTGERPRCLKALDSRGGVILCGSFSKTLAPGLRVGYLSGGRYHDEILAAKTALNFSNAPLAALTLAEFLRSGGYDHHLRTLRRLFREETQRLREAVLTHFPKGTRISEPAGGYLLWVELPAPVDTMILFEQAREQQISLAPGHLFSPAAEFKHCLRLNCAQRWNQRIAEAIAYLGRLTTRLVK